MSHAEILKYKPLVERIAGGFLKKLPKSVCREDLVSAGMEGLWNGLCKHTNDTNLEAYLTIRIRGAILDELRAQDWLPRRARDRAKLLEGTEDYVPPPATVRFDDVSEWEQNRCLATPALEQEEAIDKSREIEVLLTVLDRLPTRERLIMFAHYIKGIKFDDIAKQLGVSAPRISQIHARAMNRVRELAA